MDLLCQVMSEVYKINDDSKFEKFWCDKALNISNFLYVPPKPPDLISEHLNYTRFAKVDNITSNIEIVKNPENPNSIIAKKHRFYPTYTQRVIMDIIFRGYNHYYNKTVLHLRGLYEGQYRAVEQKFIDGICCNCDKGRYKNSKMCKEHLRQRPNLNFETYKEINIRKLIVESKARVKALPEWLKKVPQISRVAGCFAAVRAYNSSVGLYYSGEINKFDLKLRDANSSKIFNIGINQINIINGEIHIFKKLIKSPLKMSKITKKYLPAQINCESLVIVENGKYYFVSVNNYTKFEKDYVDTINEEDIIEDDETNTEAVNEEIKTGSNAELIEQIHNLPDVEGLIANAKLIKANKKIKSAKKKELKAAPAATEDVTEVAVETIVETTVEATVEVMEKPDANTKSKDKKQSDLNIDKIINEKLVYEDNKSINELSETLKAFNNKINEVKLNFNEFKTNNALEKSRAKKVTKPIVEEAEKEIENCIDCYNKLKDSHLKMIQKHKQDKKFIQQNEYIKLNASRNKIIALDPGCKTFQTGYDPKGIIYKFGQKEDLTFIKEHHEKHDKLKDLLDKVSYKTKLKLKKRILKINAKLTNRITDFHNKTAVFIARNYSNVIYPHLNTAQLIKKNSANANATTNINEKYKMSAINRQYHALAHFKFKVRLTRICAKYGSTLHHSKEYFTSKTCGKCGVVNEIGETNHFVCEAKDCGYECDRDSHGARNILIRQLKYASRL